MLKIIKDILASKPDNSISAYKGNDDFAFISYSHLDTKVVYPEIEMLKSVGYNIWFDEGIEPGTEWPEEIGDALKRSSLFIVYISNNSIQSKNVRREINYALHLEKTILAITIEETTLSPGMALQLSSIQGINKWKVTNEAYLKKFKEIINKTIQPHTTRIGSLKSQSNIQAKPKIKKKIPSDAMCPCGSGKKYINCHGKRT